VAVWLTRRVSTPRVVPQAACSRGVPACRPWQIAPDAASALGVAGLFRFQLRRKCLRGDLSVAHHERIGGQQGTIRGRTSRPEDVGYFAFNDLLRQAK
jgi:hypothetical protein